MNAFDPPVQRFVSTRGPNLNPRSAHRRVNHVARAIIDRPRARKTTALAVLGALSVFCASASAQYDSYENESDPSSEGSDDQNISTEPAPDLTPKQPEEEPADTNPIEFIGIGFKIGFLHYGNASFEGFDVTVKTPQGETQVVKNEGVPSRSGLILSLPINLGGRGIGWIFDPYLGFGQIGSYGIYTGPAVTFQLSNITYLSAGLGVRLGIITANYDDTKTAMGLDLYGRIPIDLTVYAADALGLVFEFGIGYGATGYKPEFDQASIVEGQGVEVQFGETYEIDFSVGFRLP